MQASYEIISVAQAIQQAVAPVFLLAGVGSILSVLTVRLNRVIDRYRVLDVVEENRRADYEQEIMTLLQRARWIRWAISLCTICALLVCIVIATLFVGSELNKNPSSMISMFFIAAMLALTAGLLCFLREIILSTGTLKIRP